MPSVPEASSLFWSEVILSAVCLWLPLQETSGRAAAAEDVLAACDPKPVPRALQPRQFPCPQSWLSAQVPALRPARKLSLSPFPHLCQVENLEVIRGRARKRLFTLVCLCDCVCKRVFWTGNKFSLGDQWSSTSRLSSEDSVGVQIGHGYTRDLRNGLHVMTILIWLADLLT